MDSMAEYKEPRESKRGPRRGSSNRGSRGGSRRDSRGGRDSSSGRSSYDDNSDRGSRGRRDFTETQVTCDSCGNECTVPFKPTSDKPIYCSDCFGNKDKGKSNGKSRGNSKNDLGMINKKLDKIMEALEIEF